MGEECAMLEVSKMEGEKSDDFELSLELSIGGGKYGKPENSRGKTRETFEGPKSNNDNYNNFGIFSRSDFSCDGPVDLQRRKEIQALRRQEARTKREEKLKESKKVGFLEDNNKKLLFEAQKYQARVEDRGIREKDGFLGEKIRKKEKHGADEVANDDLSLSLFTQNKNVIVPSQQMEMRDCLLYPKVQYLGPLNYGFAYPNPNGVIPCWAGGGETVSNKSLEQSSSAVSDYQSTSHKGGSCSDTGSHSSALHLCEYHSISKNEFDQHFEGNDSSCQTEPDRRLGGGLTKVAPSSNPHSSWGPFPEKPKVVPDTRFDQSNNTCSTSDNPASSRPIQTSIGGLSDKPVKPVHMPCVSTTGNGPNGRTIRGFLYKYTKTEVSIVCVCHGSSFSPAGFVEHAGGVDISHPLRHITIVGSAFG